jgi:hypothetical protein
MSEVYGQQSVSTADNEFNTLMFVIKMALQKVQTATLVQVVSCSNDGGVSPVGVVTVTPMVNQMSGSRQATPHGPIYNLPYCRIQGGANAVIMDPEPGDIGIAVFASRDISAVKAAKAPANPGSLRMFDWADGLYIGGVLNGTPTCYIQFDDGNINLVTPAGVVNINGTTVDASGNIVVKSGSTITDGVGIVVETHQHDPGTYVAGSTPVTGKSDVPTS